MTNKEIQQYLGTKLKTGDKIRRVDGSELLFINLVQENKKLKDALEVLIDIVRINNPRLDLSRFEDMIKDGADNE